MAAGSTHRVRCRWDCSDLAALARTRPCWSSARYTRRQSSWSNDASTPPCRYVLPVVRRCLPGRSDARLSDLIRRVPVELWNGVDDSRRRGSQEATGGLFIARTRQPPFCETSCEPAHVRFGSLADVTLMNCDVCSTPESGHRSVALERPLSA